MYLLFLVFLPVVFSFNFFYVQNRVTYPVSLYENKNLFGFDFPEKISNFTSPEKMDLTNHAPTIKNYLEQYPPKSKSFSILNMMEALETDIYNFFGDEDITEEEYDDFLITCLNGTGFRFVKDVFPPLSIPLFPETPSSVQLPSELPTEWSKWIKKSSSNENKKVYQESFNHPQTQNKKSDHFEVVYDVKTNFSNIGGFDDIKTELSQKIDLLKNKEKYTKFGVNIPKGLLLEGPPGNGKTLLAKAFAGECGVGFISLSGSEFVEQFVGVGAMRVRELITLAKENSPCIIFIDEIDAIGGKRNEHSHDERSSTLNQLLTVMDGFKQNENIFFLFSTNRADLLDPALVRPGRIDTKIYVGNPDRNTRKAIIDIHLENKPHKLNKEILLSQTDGLSAAQIANVFNEGMLSALRIGREKLLQEDVNFAYNRIVGGYSSSKYTYTPEMVLQIAIHEMGHVFTSLICKNTDSFSRVILNLDSPTSPGYCIFKPFHGLKTKNQLHEDMIVLLGGRVAEEILCENTVTTGASSDLREVYKLSTSMISYGFGNKIVMLDESEKHKTEIGDSIHIIIEEAYAKTSEIITMYKEEIYHYAQLLVEKKELSVEDIVFKEKTW